MITIYTDKVKAGSAGVNYGPVTLIRPSYRDDVGLYEHEFVHFLQWLYPFMAGLVLAAALYMVNHLELLPFAVLVASAHPLLYSLSKRYKLRCEVEAYKEQAKHYSSDKTMLFATYISKDYNLDITVEDAHRALIA